MVRSSLSSRSRTALTSSGAISIPAGLFSGRDGCDKTGASIEGSSIIVSAKFPVKQIPMAPTPGPPHSSCANLASDRSHFVTGLDAFAAKARNSARRHVETRCAFLGIWDGAIATEQRWHEDSEACVANPAGETRDMGADAWHLRHHNDRRPYACHMHPLGDIIERNLAGPEIFKRIVLLHRPMSHAPPPLGVRTENSIRRRRSKRTA